MDAVHVSVGRLSELAEAAQRQGLDWLSRGGTITLGRIKAAGRRSQFLAGRWFARQLLASIHGGRPERWQLSAPDHKGRRWWKHRDRQTAHQPEPQWRPSGLCRRAIAPGPGPGSTATYPGFSGPGRRHLLRCRSGAVACGTARRVRDALLRMLDVEGTLAQITSGGFEPGRLAQIGIERAVWGLRPMAGRGGARLSRWPW